MFQVLKIESVSRVRVRSSAGVFHFALRPLRKSPIHLSLPHLCGKWYVRLRSLAYGKQPVEDNTYKFQTVVKTTRKCYTIFPKQSWKYIIKIFIYCYKNQKVIFFTCLILMSAVCNTAIPVLLFHDQVFSLAVNAQSVFSISRCSGGFSEIYTASAVYKMSKTYWTHYLI